MEKQIPTPKPAVNAFNGKCIHGKEGLVSCKEDSLHRRVSRA
jgi:hypothetical protein